MDRLPHDLRHRILGFLPVEASGQGYYSLEIDPVNIVQEMYELGLDPVQIVSERTTANQLRSPQMERIVKDSLKESKFGKISYEVDSDGTELTTFTFEFIDHRVDVPYLMFQVNRLFPNVSLVRKWGFSNFSVRDPQGLFYRVLVIVSLLMQDKKMAFEHDHMTRHLELRLTPASLLNRKEPVLVSEDQCIDVLNQMATLGLEPGRLIAQRRSDQHLLRRLMADPRWEFFQALEGYTGTRGSVAIDNGREWKVWFTKSQWGDQIDLNVDKDVYLVLVEIADRLGLNFRSVNTQLHGETGSIRIIEPGFELGNYIAELTALLSSDFPQIITRTYRRTMDATLMKRGLDFVQGRRP